MIATSIFAESAATGLHVAQPANPGWELKRAQCADLSAVKVLFRRLHVFNTGLDARFALSQEWEAPFEAAMQRALRGDEAICFIARETQTGLPCAFALAAIHHDSDLWRFREWVEVEALFVDDTWHGCGLAEDLLGRTCAWAEGVGQPVVQLYVTASNERAIRFYQHAGFHTTQEIMRKVLA
ncbi:MAG: GNAT family N-acetyltransferase [Ktedonobacterales bacterium]